MGGPNLEVFKFAVYLFVPLVSLVYFGDPAWYQTHVVPVSSSPFRECPISFHPSTATNSFLRSKRPSEYTLTSCSTHSPLTREQDIPFEHHRVREELERIKNERLERRDAREREARNKDF